MNTAIIQTTADAIELVESGLASAEQVMEGKEFVDALKALARDLDAKFDAAAIKWIQANGEITSGTRRLYVGPNKTTKCKDVKATVGAVLDACGGDLEQFTECLSSGAFKPGATKKLLGDKADALFETVETADLKTKEVGTPRLQYLDLAELERFKR